MIDTTEWLLAKDVIMVLLYIRYSLFSSAIGYVDHMKGINDDAKANDDVFAQTEIRHLVKVPECEESEEGVSRKTRKALKGVIRRFLRKKNDDG
ncbi:hypothetical protein QE152_g5110 [Popillia japonica]|uniref:Uncharacterized protein n=1 Tax=Popillia japonica TaxID=7064 RepID=A0AAW1MYH7_POPJA